MTTCKFTTIEATIKGHRRRLGWIVVRFGDVHSPMGIAIDRTPLSAGAATRLAAMLNGQIADGDRWFEARRLVDHPGRLH
jgi:hypothetical protein